MSLFSCQTETNSNDKLEHEENPAIEANEEQVNLDDFYAPLPEIDLNKEYKADILRPGNIESIDGIDLQSEWWGLFNKGEGEWRLEKTIVKATPAHNPMIDQEGEASTFDISVSNENPCLLLWSDIDFLFEHDIEEIEIESKKLMPEETVAFTYYSVQYELFAYGEEGEYGNIENYTLSITRNDGGYNSAQSIASHDFFDDTMVEILFIGDIDGDDIPDLIIDDSHKYSYSKPVLFLSRLGNEAKIFVKVGERAFYSC